MRRFKISRHWAGRIVLGVVSIAFAAAVDHAVPLLSYFLGALGLALLLPLKAGDQAG